MIPSGINSTLLIGLEALATWGTIATAGNKLAILGEDLDGSEELIENMSFGGDANARDAALGDVDASGSFRHLLTLDTAPLIFKLFCDSLVSSGAADPWTHTAKTTSGALHSASLEVGFDMDTDQFKQIVGAVLDSLSFNVASKGYFEVNMGFVGKSAALSATSFDGTPTDWSLGTPLDHRALVAADVKLDGSAIGTLTGLSFNGANNVDRDIRAIGGAGVRRGVTRGRQSVSGDVTAIFEDTTLFAKTASGVYVSLDLKWTQGANRTLQLVLPRVKLQRTYPKASSERYVPEQYQFRASKDSVEGTQLKVVIVNGTAGTAYTV
jgi:hypothetical protein